MNYHRTFFLFQPSPSHLLSQWLVILQVAISYDVPFLQIRQPILFLSGLQDEMVPPMHMQLLYAKAATRNKRCIFVDFPNGMHMDTWLAGGDRYWRTIQHFLDENVPEKKENDLHRNVNGNYFKI